jgi:hypothetical protein
MGPRDQIAKLVEEAEREAYARGWREAIATLQSKAPESPSSSRYKPNGAANPDRKRGRPSKAVDLVREAIAAQPGLKGIDIARALEANNTPVLERTVRSCLRRLRESRVICQRKGKWYPKATDAIAANDKGEALETPPL